MMPDVFCSHNCDNNSLPNRSHSDFTFCKPAAPASGRQAAWGRSCAPLQQIRSSNIWAIQTSKSTSKLQLDTTIDIRAQFKSLSGGRRIALNDLDEIRNSKHKCCVAAVARRLPNPHPPARGGQPGAVFLRGQRLQEPVIGRAEHRAQDLHR